MSKDIKKQFKAELLQQLNKKARLKYPTANPVVFARGDQYVLEGDEDELIEILFGSPGNPPDPKNRDMNDV